MGTYAHSVYGRPPATNEIIYIIFVPGQKPSVGFISSRLHMAGQTSRARRHSELHAPCTVANGSACRRRRSLCRLVAKHMAPDSGLQRALWSRRPCRLLHKARSRGHVCAWPACKCVCVCTMPSTMRIPGGVHIGDTITKTPQNARTYRKLVCVVSNINSRDDHAQNA